uniref:Uncharacterized protein n=1 Tax=Amphimedon queenslandica TaxID=400682 RepID=A0A1X7VI26_AMPQE
YSLNGTYNELLTADGSDVPAAAKRGGSGTYRCEVCYNTSRSTFECNSTSVINNVI